MKKLLLTIFMLLCAGSCANAELIITSVFDGDENEPRGIEVFVGETGSYEDWTLELEFNANTDPTQDEFGVGYIFDSTIYNEGDFLYVTATPGASTLLEQSGIIIGAAAFNINGDDRVRIRNTGGQVIDQYGVSGVDGTGEPWEYTGSFAYRETVSGSEGFDIDDWFIAPVNTLEINGNAQLSDRLGSFTNAIPEPSSFVLLALAGVVGLSQRRKR